MSKNSPITNRVQSALHMKSSAIKQDDGLEGDNKKPPVYADDQYGAVVSVTEKPVLENKVKQIQDSEKKTYSYDDLYNDSIAAGSSAEDAQGIVQQAKEYNESKYQTHNPTAEGKTDNTYDVGKVDADGNPIMIDDPSGATEQVEVMKSVTEDVPSEYKRMTQFQVGQNFRAARKAMKKEAKLKKMAGVGTHDDDGNKLSRKERLANTDVAKQIAGMNFEIAGNINQDKAGTTHSKNYTNTGDDSLKTRHNIVDEPKKEEKEEGIAMYEKNKTKGIKMKTPLNQRKAIAKGAKKVKPSEGVGAAAPPKPKEEKPSATPMTESPIKFKGLFKGIGKGVKGVGDATASIKKSATGVVDNTKKYVKELGDEFDKGRGTYKEPVKPKTPKTKAQYKKLGGTNPNTKSKYGVKNSGKGYSDYLKSFDDAAGSSAKVAKTGAKIGGDAAKTGGKYRPLGIKKRYIAGVGAAGYLGRSMMQGDDSPAPVTPGPINPDPVKPPVKPDPVKPTPVKPTPVTPGGGGSGGGTPVTGVVEGTMVKKPTGPVKGPGGNLSNTVSQRQADRMTKAEGRQARKNMKLANKQQRRNLRRANPTLVGGMLRKTFGGKTYDSSITNMNVSSPSNPTGYNLKDKKAKGQFGNTSRPGYSGRNA